MSGVKLEVQWSPIHQDKFIVWGNDIFLYEVSPSKDPSRTSCVRISENTVAHLLASNTNQHYVKCVDIHPHPETDILLAIGQANGKVVLTSFGSTSFDSRGLIGKELAPKHARQCNALQWSPAEAGLLAVGLDKHRGDHSVLLWDIVNGSMGGSSEGLAAKPLLELGLTETAHSLTWIAQAPRSLALGMNHKILKLFDLRDTTKPINSTPTKAVFGLTSDPHSEHQLASYVEGQISIWDLRNFDKPILSLSQSKPITKLLWCPTRRNLLGALTRDSSCIFLYDIQHAVVGSADGPEPAIAIERNVSPEPHGPLSSFSWHHSHENRLLAITARGKIADYTVIERITLNWAPSSRLVWTYGRQTLRYMEEQDPAYYCLNDISVKIKERALNDYGLKPDLWQNADLVAEDDGLRKLWLWLNTNRALMGDEVAIAGCRGVKHPGVRAILKMEPYQTNGTSTKSEMICVPWTDLGASCQSAVRIYRSEERERALQLCGWRFERWWVETSVMGVSGSGVGLGISLNSFLDRLEAEEEGSHTRVAAIAIFNLRIRLAIQVLNGGATAASAVSINNPTGSIESSNLNIVAMALSGYTGDKNSIWRELCMASRCQLTDPYLRAIFAFLTAEGDGYDSVLNESGMAVEDRVAFACMYLSDLKLSEYLERLTFKLTEEGNLAGILLTGTSKEGLDLLQRYVDLTGDVQSVSVLAVRAFSIELIKDQKVQEWLESYRCLLDGWRLWNQRAQFDVALGACNPTDKPPQQVFLSCNFCGKSVSMYMQGLSRSRGPFGRLGGTSNKHKISSCPNCRKPLPRCAICLINMGTPSGFLAQQRPFSEERLGDAVVVSGGTSGNKEKKLSEFSSWFTWCQTCRHGGHATHMAQWFKLHSECPVTGCTCRCMLLDAVVRLGSVSISGKNNI